jgi:hypothetical protein
MTDSADRVQELLDRNDIADLATAVGRWIDGKRWDEAHTLYTADATVSSPAGTLSGIDALIELVRQNHEPYEQTQHFIVGPHIELNGDTAMAAVNAIAVFVPRAADPATHRITGVRYDFEVIRTSVGWRFRAVRITPVWIRE